VGHLDNVNPLEMLVATYKKFFGEHASIIFDVGTRDGEDLVYLNDKLNIYGSQSFAIDANPDMAKQTKINYPWFTVINTAISNYNGTTKFQKVEHERIDYVGSSSIYADKLVEQEDIKDHVRIIEVPVTTMCDLLIDFDLHKSIIDLVKVDIEGYTYEFLDGCRDTLKNIKCLHLETEQYSTHPYHKNSEYIESFMNNAGFYLADKSYEWGWHIEDQIWINKQLAINNIECWRKDA